MRKTVFIASLVLLVTLLVTGAALAGGAPGGRPLYATMNGAAERPNSGDPDGSGQAWVTLNQGQSQVCWMVEYAGIATPLTAAHIHVGGPEEAGPPVVPIPVGDGTSTLFGCASAEPDLIKAIRQNPGGYYVNVHNAEYQAGALRGQLTAR